MALPNKPTGELLAVRDPEVEEKDVDLLIVGGALFYNFSVEELEAHPSLISKLNTLVQILLVILVLLVAFHEILQQGALISRLSGTPVWSTMIWVRPAREKVNSASSLTPATRAA